MKNKLSKDVNISRWLITIPTLFYGIVPPIVDFTETHVFHPDWTTHSRLHMVWLLVTNSALALFSIYLMWFRAREPIFNIKVAGLIGICIFIGFLIAASLSSLYGGSLSDSGGVPPIAGIDSNLLAFIPAFFMVSIGLLRLLRSKDTN